MLFFALSGSEELGRAVADAGGFPVAPHEERDFGGGEQKSRPLAEVRGRDVFVLHSLFGAPELSANDKLCRLLFFLAACRDHGARRVTAVAPYLAYSRKDRQTKPQDPVTSRYVATLFEAMGTDCVVTLDVHNLAAFQNAFRCQTLHVDTLRLFAEDIRSAAAAAPIAVVSPDAGGVKRAQLLREAAMAITGREVGFGLMEKRRTSGEVSGSLFAGEVDGRDVWIVDDIIAGGDTMLRAARACSAHGARRVHLLAAHALFGDQTAVRLDDPAIDSITVTDAAGPVAAAKDRLGDRLRCLSVATEIAAAIRLLHSGAAGGEGQPTLRP
jgi:ribose-phosphate pyrophosphokinase